MRDRPQARTEQLISERIDEELVIYDQSNNVAHCLSREAGRVWEYCDGRLTEAEIANQLTLSVEIVQRALAALEERGLLDDGSVAAPGYSRRQAAVRLARIGGAALAGPLVYSVDVGSAAAKASHLAAGCILATCGSCSSTTGCALCNTAGTTSTNSMCASGSCYCSLVNLTGASQTVLRCSISSTCRGDFVAGVCTGTTNPRCDCSVATPSQCCGNRCILSQCRSDNPSC